MVKKPVGSSKAGVEGVEEVYTPPRRSPRISFAAEVRATELDSGSEIWAETTNLSRGGCYVLTRRPFPQGTLLLIEIRKHGARFVTDASVVYAIEREAMGLSFLNIPPDQLPILESWLASAADRSGCKYTTLKPNG